MFHAFVVDHLTLKKETFKKFFQEYYQECQIVWIQIVGPDLDLNCLQRSPLASKEFSYLNAVTWSIVTLFIKLIKSIIKARMFLLVIYRK